MNNKIIVSACLAGINCRYNCKLKTDPRIVKLVAEGKAIPVCPEQLGGLSTPRLPSERKGNKVFFKDGTDVTENFLKGAEEALKIAKSVGAKKAILKTLSPSCGKGTIYDGTFTGDLKPGNGIFTDFCLKNNIEVKTEEDEI